MVNRSHWKNNPKREVKIFRVLEYGAKTFTELDKELKWTGNKKWGLQTLTVHLQNSVEKGYIEREKHGRKVFYTLIQHHPYVRQMLGLDRPSGPDVRIHNHIELDKLDEEEFIADWLTSIKFNFLNIIQDFMFLGENSRELDEETDSIKLAYRFIEGHIQDLVDDINWNGMHMAKRVKLRTLDPKKLWIVRNKLLKQIKNTFLEQSI